MKGCRFMVHHDCTFRSPHIAPCVVSLFEPGFINECLQELSYNLIKYYIDHHAGRKLRTTHPQTTHRAHRKLSLPLSSRRTPRRGRQAATSLIGPQAAHPLQSRQVSRNLPLEDDVRYRVLLRHSQIATQHESMLPPPQHHPQGRLGSHQVQTNIHGDGGEQRLQPK
jgi:hypothetical protein